MLNLDFRDPRPIYEQVKEGLRRLIIAGVIREGEKLPSVRALASSLTINPNTIQRAYDALEQEGYLYSLPGKGSFAASHAHVDQGRQEHLLRQFDAAVSELLYLGLSTEALIQRIRLKGAAAL